MKEVKNQYRPDLFLERLEKVMELNHFKTNKALSDATGIGEGTISKWKRNNTIPDTDTLTKICNGCVERPVDIDYLLGRIDTPKHENHLIHIETGLDEDAIEKLRTYKHGGTIYAIDTTAGNETVEYYDPANSFINHMLKCDELSDIITIANEQKKLRKINIMLLKDPGYDEFKKKYDQFRSVGGPGFAKFKLFQEPISDDDYGRFIEACQEFNLPEQLILNDAHQLIDFDDDVLAAAEGEWPHTDIVISALISLYRAEMVYKANMHQLNRLFSDVIDGFVNDG